MTAGCHDEYLRKHSECTDQLKPGVRQQGQHFQQFPFSSCYRQGQQ